ncbi:MAG: SipW-dependent-type signal peptide-containing protein [Clostridia bacterium]|nr:SipW-dependent-type signal peptide-containing protein [Clostridia bacterium]
MTNRKTTKRALLASVMAIIICFSMLLGTTYAWFTDTVVASKNRIVSGNLDIELDYAVYDENGELGEWIPVNEDTNLFNEDALYEPGYTEVVAFRVRNVGTLALKYKLGINILSEKAGINVFGSEFMLSDYLFTGLVSEGAATTRDEYIPFATTKLNEATNDMTVDNPNFGINTLVPNDGADAGEDEEIFEIVVHMPTWVDNTANFLTNEDDTFANQPEIEFGLTLVATQWTYEEDDFDDQYDADAEFPVVSNTAEIVEAVKGGATTVLINNDIELPEQLEVNGTLTIIGDGESTIYSGANGTRVVNVADQTDALLVIDNINLVVDNNLTYTRGISFFGNDGLDVTIKNSTIVNNSYYAINVASDNKEVVINIEDSEITGYAALNIWSEGTVVNVKNSTLTGINKSAPVDANRFAVIVVETPAENVVINLEDTVVNAVYTNGVTAREFHLIYKNDSYTINETNVDWQINGNPNSFKDFDGR